MTPEQRVQMGKSVRDNIQFIQCAIEDDLSTRSEEYRQNFWQEFATEMKRRDLVQAEGDPPKEFTDEQAQAFGLQPCPFKAFIGVAYRAVPYDYLANLVDLNKRLELYVRWRAKKERIVSQG